MPYSILIVEDDLTFATMLKTWLGKKGFLVDTAGNSARARKQLDAQSYNLVLSDLRLPDQDGISLLAWMKEHGHQIPLIIINKNIVISGIDLTGYTKVHYRFFVFFTIFQLAFDILYRTMPPLLKPW
jgi:DNA-binding NtrC family response regulator